MNRDGSTTTDADERARFTQALLDDLQALEHMIDAGRFEAGVRRIGAEQEVFLVDEGMNPAPIAPQVLEALEDERLTTEIARFNLEANLTPRALGGDCLSRMESEVNELLEVAGRAAGARGAHVLLTGILPTLRQGHLAAENMAPARRYADLARAVREQRGHRLSVHIKGLDELDVVHDHIMLEACNTSFQLHLQVAPDEFARFYNAAQLVTAPVLACAANSPVLFNHRLWSETRVALFADSVDDRSTAQKIRRDPPRVLFGDGWVRSSVLELFREDVARFPILLTDDFADDSLGVARSGGTPRLRALCLFNGTVYRWNRPCYGVTDGRPHLRIENRALPAGPTVVDEIANAAFYYGLLIAVADRHPWLDAELRFDDVKRNFLRAARHGLDAQLTWTDDSLHPVRDLVLEELLPEARRGLLETGVEMRDVDRYLGIVEDRVVERRNGATWLLDSLASMDPAGSEDLRHRSLTATLLAAQRRGDPVHKWPLAQLADEPFRLEDSFASVGQLMTTDLLAVHPGDVVDLAASLMSWERARFVAVEKEDGELVGLISAWSLLRVLTRGESFEKPIPVESVMDEPVVTVTVETPLEDAVELMETHRVGCLPVVEGGRLVGLLTQAELVQATRHLLGGQRRAPERGPRPDLSEARAPTGRSAASSLTLGAGTPRNRGVAPKREMAFPLGARSRAQADEPGTSVQPRGSREVGGRRGGSRRRSAP